MEKIKAGEVLKRLGFKYAWVNDGCMIIISTHPKGSEEGLRVYLGSDTSIIDYDNSTHEIDFSEGIEQDRLSLITTTRQCLLNEIEELSNNEYSLGTILTIIRGRHELVFESTLGNIKIPKDSPIFVDANGIVHESTVPHPLMATDEELGKHMSKFIGTQSKSIFQEGDTVHVLSYSNQGELGISTQGVVKQIKSNSFVAVEVINGIEEIHEEKNISFTPFSIHEAGFSQVRPKPQPKKGDWGWFWDSEDSIEDGFRYATFESMNGKFFKASNGCSYDNFSLKNPVQNC